MTKKNDMREAAHTFAIRKLKELHRVEKTCDEPSREFILAQKLLIDVEERLVFAAANAIAMNVSSRHLGMALAQAMIGPLDIMSETVRQLRGEDKRAELLVTYFGRTLEIAHHYYGIDHLSVTPRSEGEA